MPPLFPRGKPGGHPNRLSPGENPVFPLGKSRCCQPTRIPAGQNPEFLRSGKLAFPRGKTGKPLGKGRNADFPLGFPQGKAGICDPEKACPHLTFAFHLVSPWVFPRDIPVFPWGKPGKPPGENLGNRLKNHFFVTPGFPQGKYQEKTRGKPGEREC